MGKFKPISGKNLIKLLKKNGALLKEGRGSHVIVKFNEKTTLIPKHGNRDIGNGLYFKILKDLGIDDLDKI